MKQQFFVVAAVLLSSHLWSQNPDTTVLEPVIVTAEKYPVKQSETGKVVTVITRQQLDRSSGKTLSELLNTTAGTNIIGANNVLGTNQTISIRGASAGNVLLLIDGIPVNDPSVITNYFDLNLIPIDQVEKIEILKGGQSTLYGSDAVSGVINIITRKAGNKKMNTKGSLAGGSYNTLKQNVGITGRIKAIDYSVAYTHLASDGFSTARDTTGNANFDKDGIEEHSVTARLGFRISKKIQANIFSTYSYYKSDLDASAFTDEKDYTVKNDNVQNGIGFVYLQNKGALHFNYHFNYVERDYTDDSIYKSSPYTDFSKAQYIGRTHYAEIYNNWKWQQFELLLGADYRFNNTDQFYFSSGVFGPYAPPLLHVKMKQTSPYGSLVYKKNGLNIELGGRWNNHSEYGSNFTYTFNPAYLINQKTKLFANLYSAFKTPTLYQLFDPSAGNASLEPEKGTIGEVGIELFPTKTFHARVVGFYRSTKNAILYTFDPNTFASKYENVNKQTNYGGEFEASYTTEKLALNANYAYTDGKTKSAFDGTGAPVGKDTSYYNLYRIPKHAINLNVGVQATKSLFVSAQLHTVSKREEFIYGSTPENLDGYSLIDVYGEYKIARLFKLFLDLKNVTNKKYTDILGYNSRKFNFMTGVSFQL